MHEYSSNQAQRCAELIQTAATIGTLIDDVYRRKVIQELRMIDRTIALPMLLRALDLDTTANRTIVEILAEFLSPTEYIEKVLHHREYGIRNLGVQLASSSPEVREAVLQVVEAEPHLGTQLRHKRTRLTIFSRN